MKDIDNNLAKAKIQNLNILSVKLYIISVLSAVMLIAVSYIIDLFLLRSSGSIQDSTSVSSVLSGIGTIIIKYSYIFVSLGIVLRYKEITALPSAVIGSLLVSQGCTFSDIGGSLAGISGIFAGILCGYISVVSARLCRKISVKYKVSGIIGSGYFLPIVITCLFVLSINSLGSFINSVSTSLLKSLADNRTVFLPLIIGIFTVIDGGGPLHLCAYIFGVTSIVAEEPQVMAAVIGAGMIPSLSASLFAYIYKDRLDSFEIKGAYFGIIPALLGLPQLSYLFYITRKMKFILPCMIGSGLTALLSVMLGCSTTATEKGFLNFGSFDKPLFLIVCIIFGVFVTTILMSLTIKTTQNEKAEASENAKKELAPKTAQA